MTATTRSPAEIQGGRDHHGQRAALRQDRGAGGQTPFGPQEVETMSKALSPSFACCYGLARVARVWKISRASCYRSLKEMPPASTARATASYGRDCALLAFARAPAVCDG